VPDRAIAQECVEGYLYVPAPIRVLILRRPPSRGGIWVPVSGKVEARDRDFRSALRREIAEETGFTAPLPLHSLDWEVVFDGPDGRPWRLHAYRVELQAAWTPRLSEEHDAYEYVSPREAIHRLHYEDNRSAVRLLLQRLKPERVGGVDRGRNA
jgi:8-oxo-dGTP pyrophosphatase MutT (NUDIX family)